MEWTVDRETRPWVLRATSQGSGSAAGGVVSKHRLSFFLTLLIPLAVLLWDKNKWCRAVSDLFYTGDFHKIWKSDWCQGPEITKWGKITFHRQRTILISKIISLYLWQFQKHTLWRHTWNKPFCWFLILDKAQRQFCSFSVLPPPWSAIYRKINELLLHLVHMQRCIMYFTELARFLVFQNKAIITSIAKDGVMLWVIIVSSIAKAIFLITQCKSEFVYTDSKFTSKGKTPRITKTIFISNRKGDFSLTGRGSL